MTYAVGRVVSATRCGAWPLIETWQRLSAGISVPQWRATALRGTGDELVVSQGALPDWEAIARAVADPQTTDISVAGGSLVVFAAQVRVRLDRLAAVPSAIAEQLYQTTSDVVVVEDRARAITMAVDMSLMPSALSRLAEEVVALAVGADALWAHVVLEQDLPGPFRPAHREWSEWSPIAGRQIPCSGLLLLLSERHGASLNDLSAFEPRSLRTRSGHAIVLVGDSRRSTVVPERVLAPVLMRPPIDPIPCFLLNATFAHAPLGVRVSVIDEVTVCVRPDGEAAARGDAEAARVLADQLGAIYSLLQSWELDWPSSPPALYAPRLFGDRTLLRPSIRGQRPGLPIWFTGRADGTRLGVRLVGAGAARMDAAVGSSDLSFLRLLLDFERERRPDAGGILIGEVPSPDSLEVPSPFGAEPLLEPAGWW